MYQSLTIKNFRCFDEIKFAPLDRINLIIGKNNVGKTAFLETFFLHLGFNQPELLKRIDFFRGLNLFKVDAEDLWGWNFYGKDMNKVIEIISQSEGSKNRSLRISLTKPKAPVLAPSGTTDYVNSKGSITTAFGQRDLILEYQDEFGKKKTSRTIITTKGELKTEGDIQVSTFPVGIYLSNNIRSIPEDSDRFSQLDRVGRIGEVLEIMQILEPRLKRLALISKGGFSIIHGDIGVRELVPIPLMGDGMFRLLQIVLAIKIASEGTVLIDEIGNGLHHSVLLAVWEAIAKAARDSKTQIFGTTHSFECIDAAHKALSKSNVYDFRLHRIDRINGKLKTITYDKEALEAALKAELEVR